MSTYVIPSIDELCPEELGPNPDFNCDGVLDDRDVDLISYAIYYPNSYEGSQHIVYDIWPPTGPDGQIGARDRAWLFWEHLQTDPVDFNLDGVVTASGDGANFLKGLHGQNHDPNDKHLTGFLWGDTDGSATTTAVPDGAAFLAGLKADTALPEPGSLLLAAGMLVGWLLHRRPRDGRS